jgi:hypothetical protein
MDTSDKVAGKTKIVRSKVKELVTKPAGVKRAPAGPKLDPPATVKTAVTKAAASKPVTTTAITKTAAANAAVTKAALKVKNRAKK